jgi:hypothetical protein
VQGATSFTPASFVRPVAGLAEIAAQLGIVSPGGSVVDLGAAEYARLS